MDSKQNQQENGRKGMLSHEKIYMIMQWLPIGVSSIFFIKNIFAGDITAMITIGLCLMVFGGMLGIFKIKNVKLYTKELGLAIALPFLVFMISLNSGESYSDDFSLFLAVIGMTGLYLEPLFTKIQIILIDIILVLMYIAHPEKAESLSQYILCLVAFTLAAFLFYLVIKRGRSFIEISQERAEESEQLLASIRSMGKELQEDFAISSAQIETETKALLTGSEQITKGSDTVARSCSEVQGTIKETERQITQLNKEVNLFETALSDNQKNIESMGGQLHKISETIGASGTNFRCMEEQMKEIAGIAKQINDISFQLTILSLNAAVEATHAGDSGSGFQVLAEEMRALSESSTGFSNRVADVLTELLDSVEKTAKQISGSEVALETSEGKMQELVNSFERLNKQFSVLYQNIELQTTCVTQIDHIFAQLHTDVTEMNESSKENNSAVYSIAKTMKQYKGNVDKIVENTQSI